MWAPLTTYKKPLTKEEEKQEFDSIYQLLQSMVRPSSKPATILHDTPPVPPVQPAPPSLPILLLTNGKQEDRHLKDRSNTVEQAPSETIQEKKPRGRPKKIVAEPIVIHGIKCPTCQHHFPKNSDYLIHFDTSELCMKAHSTPHVFHPIQPITQPIHSTVHDLLRMITLTETNSHECKFCRVGFKNKSTETDHFMTSPSCNRLAYMELKKIVSEL